MILDVMQSISQRCKYPISSKMDGYIDHVLEAFPDRCCFVTTDAIFAQCFRKSEYASSYYITAVFDLSQVFLLYTTVRMSLYVLSKKESKIVKTGVYTGKLVSNKKKADVTGKEICIEVLDNIPGEYKEYCNLINQWVNKGGFTPCDSDYYEFNAIERGDFDVEKATAQRYTKQVFEVFDLLKTEKTVTLSDIAEIIVPQRKQIDKGYSLNIKCLKYPFSRNDLQKGAKTDLLVKKGDIIYCSNDLLYLVNSNLENVYVSPSMKIIRPFDGALAEYLYVYLNSDTAKIIRDALSVGTVLHYLPLRDLSTFPVIEPPKDVSEYKQIFETIYSESEEKNVNELVRLVSNITGGRTTLEGTLLKEQAKKIRLIKDPQVRQIITDDIDELKICYENGAYKATLVLAGSILEAFLIDWLGNVHNRDYYNQDYYVLDRRDPSKTKKADLLDFIDAIAEIKKPDWMEEQSKAHHIRDKRNLVHAKLCMKRNQQINETTCKMVIDYLIEIISTRYKNFAQR
ncbi:MAG: hypothetical protein IKV30_05435 [Clostridia bacterium]|nr:hypothetical protein [Clostridia bacterium]